MNAELKLAIQKLKELPGQWRILTIGEILSASDLYWSSAKEWVKTPIYGAKVWATNLFAREVQGAK